MEELIYLHDGSFEGLLTAVASAVKSPHPVHGIFAVSHYVPTLFANTLMIVTDREQAARLFHYLHRMSGDAAHLVIQAFLSEEPAVGGYLFELVKLCLERGGQALQLHTNHAVHSLLNLSRKVGFEAHRLNGILRFRILKDGLQYAPFQSDHNVIGHCAKHFQYRLATRRWILHDTGRDFALYWDKKQLRSVEIAPDFRLYAARFGELPDNYLTDEELNYQRLWRRFHMSISNTQRENKVLQRRFLPNRYWHFLVEMKA